MVNIWDATTSPYTIWGSFAPTISATGTTVLPLLNDPSFDGSDDAYKPALYANSTGAFSGIFVPFQAGSVPTTSLPVNFVIELEDGENTVDYVALSITNNCLSDDTLIEKMVEVEE